MANDRKWNARLQQPAVLAGVAGLAAVFGLAGALVVLGNESPSRPAPIITQGDLEAGNYPVRTSRESNIPRSALYASSVVRTKAEPVRVLPVSQSYVPQQASETYPAAQQQAPAPAVRGNNATRNESLQYNTQPPVSPDDAGAQDPNTYEANAPQAYNGPASGDGSTQEDAGYDALEQTDQAPPALPEYEQPPAPDDNYLWTPGYWGFSTGYYWVPGAWVAPPFYGALWTPPWWGWYSGRYYLHRGYWGPHIGYYGGISYGHGYIGSGFYGGYWQGRSFFYNRAVTNVNTTRVRNVYERNVVVNNNTYFGRSLNRLSFNGPSGVQARPRPYEAAALREAHYAPVPAQMQSRRLAASDRGQFFSQNHGRPAETFQQRPLSTPGAIADTPQRPAFNRGGEDHGFHAGQPAVNRGQPVSPEVNRPGVNSGAGASRNDLIHQRNGIWGASGERNSSGNEQAVQIQQNQQQQAQQLQQNQRLQQENALTQDRDAQRQPQQWEQRAQQQRDALQGRDQQMQQQRTFQLQQQQNHHAALQQQRDVQQQQQQQRNLQYQQQRDAAEQMRGQQQQRNVQEQQQRNQQMQQQQQQRMADQQQRAAQYQQQQQQRQQMAPQHIEVRPSPQTHMEVPHAPHQFSGMHGR